jgi:AcrR family transcriptional regulator
MARKVVERRPYHHGDLRNALLESALRLIVRQGPDALTLRAVARDAGVSPAAPYRHFADKEALLAALAEGGFRELAREMRVAAEGGEDEVGRLIAIGSAYVEFARAHPAHFHVMFGPAAARKDRHPALAQAAAEAYRLLVEAVAAGQQAGALRPEESQGAHALTAWATVHGLSSLLVDGQLGAVTPGSSLAAQVHAVLHTLFVGLGAERPGPTGSAGARSAARRSK